MQQPVLIVWNPRSGRGRAGSAVAELAASFARAHCPVRTLAVAPGAAFAAQLSMLLRECRAIVIAGGDGTVHYTLPLLAAMESTPPLYHFPLGTENLFARELRASRDTAEAVRAVMGARGVGVMQMDLGELVVREPAHAGAHALLFALMVSIGPDAGVVARLAGARRGAISHASYLAPIAHELCAPCLPRTTIVVDGRTLVAEQPGMTTIANSRHYGVRINPARDARTDDGALDVVFFPAAHAIGAAIWLVRSLCASHLPAETPQYQPLDTRRSHHAAAAAQPGYAITARGTSIRVRAESTRPIHAQCDGEHALSAQGSVELHCTVRPGALRVIAQGRE